MMCGCAKELLAASWAGELDAESAAKLKLHLSACPECALEMQQLGAMWERLADLPAPEPSHALDLRWHATLESLAGPRKREVRRFSLVWQLAVAMGCLVVGLLIGAHLPRTASPDSNEVAKLREEVASTKELVALSLLQQQSATERLRGVDYSARMPVIEPGVVAALIQAVNHDPNVNVRLAAIDALSRVSGQAQVRQSLTRSLAQQDSPMVQAALVDYVTDARDHDAIGTLRELAARPDLNPAVRDRIASAMRQLTEYR